MTIKDCPDCGGTHYGSNKCPYTYHPPENKDQYTPVQRRQHAAYFHSVRGTPLANIPIDEYLALRDIWEAAGGHWHGPIVETGDMPEKRLLAFIHRQVVRGQVLNDLYELVRKQDMDPEFRQRVEDALR